MGNLIVQIDAPPVGELELTGDGSNPTDSQMAEETAARERTLDALRPYLASLPKRPARRAGNVSRVELLGGNTWSELNHYAVLVTVDIGDPGLEDDLKELLPTGSTVAVTRSFEPLEEWPTPGTGT
jgi:hypothetical protein